MNDERAVVGERRWVNAVFGLLAWVLGLVFFFPVFWMVLNSFKSEADANTSPKLFFHPTLDRYHDVTASAGGVLSAGQAFTNSAVVVIVSTLIVLTLAIPAAYALAIRPVGCCGRGQGRLATAPGRLWPTTPRLQVWSRVA